jgi:hypothetical protein
VTINGLRDLRARFEAILFEGYDAAIPKHTFRKRVSGVVTESASEGICAVSILGARPADEGHNPQDGFFIVYRTVRVELLEQYTEAGEDFESDLTESTDAGNIESISDRFETSAHLIKSALLRVDNWSGLTPHMFSVTHQSTGEPTFDAGIANCVLEFEIGTRDTISV